MSQHPTQKTVVALPAHLAPQAAPDPSAYLSHLAHTTLSEAQKIEILETLWNLMSYFVEWGLGMDPATLASRATAEMQSGGTALPAPCSPPPRRRKTSRRATIAREKPWMW